MSPNFLPDSFVLSIKHPFQRLKVGDVVLVNHDKYAKMIKRIHTIDIEKTESGAIFVKSSAKNTKITLKGDNAQSVSSEQMGEINLSQVIGKVIWTIPPPNRIE